MRIEVGGKGFSSLIQVFVMCLAVPGRLIEIQNDDAEFRWGWVDFSGIRRWVCLSCVPDAQLGDFVLVHAGVAISIVEPGDASWISCTLSAVPPLSDTHATP